MEIVCDFWENVYISWFWFNIEWIYLLIKDMYRIFKNIYGICFIYDKDVYFLIFFFLEKKYLLNK